MKKLYFYTGIILLFAIGASACSKAEPQSPTETFKTYTKAAKAKDITTMKLLLSNDTMKMNEVEAQARGVTVDEVVKNETLFTDDQKTIKLKDEKIEGETATLQVEGPFGGWQTVPFVREDGVWKIDKKGYAQRMMDEIDKSNQQLDDLIDRSRQPVDDGTGMPPPTSEGTPLPPLGTPVPMATPADIPMGERTPQS